MDSNFSIFAQVRNFPAFVFLGGLSLHLNHLIG